MALPLHQCTTIIGESLSEPCSSDQRTHACVNDYLSARARGEYCSCKPRSPAGFRAGELKQPLVDLEDKAHAAGKLIAARKECVSFALVCLA
jgi:hypothetical protein